MALANGTRIGPFEITGRIGAGGMGEVYRACDTNLGRDVAVKVLPEAFSQTPERLARFEREARTLASLSHPNIAIVHGVETAGGIRALVMELVDGPTIADRLADAPIHVPEALAFATQIAEALEAAHERGIIHRDLKPANVKLRPDGTVKVLDFGLAKFLEPADEALAPTVTATLLTEARVMLGTPAYMAPEQVRGSAADKRSDVWAFGAVLFEMLTGKRAFDGRDTADTIAAILKTDPDWSLLPADTPSQVAVLLKNCLAKDRRHRLGELATARFVITELCEPQAPFLRAPVTSPASAGRSLLKPVAVASLATALIVGGGAWTIRSRPVSPSAVVRFSFTPAGQSFTGIAQQMVAVSHDGSRLAYTANGRIYVRALEELDARAVWEPERAVAMNPMSPVFSPDGNSIVFLAPTEHGLTLSRVPLSGGPAVTLATLTGAPTLSGVSWSGDAILVGAGRRVLRVPAKGGSPQQIIDVQPGELLHGPQLLPDGNTVLFTLTRSAGDDQWDSGSLVAHSLSDGTRKVLIERASDGRYVPSGHLVYALGGIVHAVPVDATTLTVKGPGVPVISGVRRAAGGVSASAELAFSDTGTLVYVPGPTSTARALVVGDARSDPVPLDVPPALYAHPRASSNGRLVAVARNEGSSSDIWTYALAGTVAMKRLTFGGESRFPVWFADSHRVTFQSSDHAIWWQSVDGGVAERLTTAAEGESHVPEAWSRDGTRLLYSVREGSMFTLWVLTLSPDSSRPLGNVRSADPLSATFSPDGRWIAYASTSISGGVISPNRGVFVEPYPPTGERHQAPKRLLDYHPVWTPDGKSLMYVPGSNRPIVSVPVITKPAIEFGTPVELPRAPLPGLLSTGVRDYDVLPDGRIVSLSPVSGPRSSAVGAVDIRVVLNWFEELRRLAPAK